MRAGIVTVRLTSRWPYNPLSLAIGIAAGSRQFSHAITVIGHRAYEASMTHGCRAGTIDDLMGVLRCAATCRYGFRTSTPPRRSPRRR
jgi:hypothetical protein